MTIGEALSAAARTLAEVSETPRLDAELLMAHALGMSREALLLCAREAAAPAEFAALIERRQSEEPIAYITGHKAFWTIELAVTPDVLIPRPDTETLIEAAVAHFGQRGPEHILDLGTGSGALLLAALTEWPGASGVGVDASAEAVAVARGNAAALGLSHRAAIELGGWEAAGRGTCDLVLCNPPYIGIEEPLPASVRRYEPPQALFAGADGLDEYRVLAPLLRLPTGGIACFEIGATQAAAVSALFEAEGFSSETKRDLAGLDRCVIVRPDA